MFCKTPGYGWLFMDKTRVNVFRWNMFLVTYYYPDLLASGLNNKLPNYNN